MWSGAATRVLVSALVRNVGFTVPPPYLSLSSQDSLQSEVRVCVTFERDPLLLIIICHALNDSHTHIYLTVGDLIC